MYGALAPHQQLVAFDPAPVGFRKARLLAYIHMPIELAQVILATNIAETSITINGIKHVVDTGLVKARSFTPRIGLETLAIRPISQAQVAGTLINS